MGKDSVPSEKEMQSLLRMLDEGLEALKPEELTLTPCPDSWTFALYMQGEVDEKTREDINSHIAVCDGCYEEYAALVGPEKIMAAINAELNHHATLAGASNGESEQVQELRDQAATTSEKTAGLEEDDGLREWRIILNGFYKRAEDKFQKLEQSVINKQAGENIDPLKEYLAQVKEEVASAKELPADYRDLEKFLYVVSEAALYHLIDPVRSEKELNSVSPTRAKLAREYLKFARREMDAKLHQAAAEARADSIKAGTDHAESDDPSAITKERSDEFERFLASFYMTAMRQLGLTNEEGAEPHTDLMAARQTIENLSLLAKKTKGNLTIVEEDFLQNALYELRMAYVDVSKASEWPEKKTGTHPAKG